MTRFWSFATRSKMEKINIRCSSVDDLKTILSENHCKIQRAENHSKKGSVNKSYWSKMERVKEYMEKYLFETLLQVQYFQTWIPEAFLWRSTWTSRWRDSARFRWQWFVSEQKKTRSFKSQNKQLNYHINFNSKMCSLCYYAENFKQIKV